MNTALILHLLALVQHAVHGHHFRGLYVPECFEYVKVIDPKTHFVHLKLICGIIHVWPHGAIVTWR